MPQQIVILGGSSLNYFREIKTVTVNCADSWVTLLTEVKEVCFENIKIMINCSLI